MNKYNVKNKYLYMYLTLVRFITRIFKIFVTGKYGVSKNISSIIIANNGHLGDIVILIAAVNVLKRNYPNLKIGIVTGSWNKIVLDYYNTFDNIHYLDHWKVNRGNKGIIEKFLQYLKTLYLSSKEIKECNYDIAFDTYHFFPNSSFFLFYTGIKYRIGYISGGFEDFYSKVLKWIPKEQNIAQYHIDLFKEIFFSIEGKPFYHLKEEYRLELEELKNLKYMVIHPGAGDSIKLWDIKEWSNLIELLLPNYDKIILTGSGINDNEICKELSEGKNNIINLCNKLMLDDLESVIKNSDLLVCLDSFIAHFAAQFNKPTFVISTGINNKNWWTPINNKCIVIVSKTDCNPCYNSKGCNLMTCIKSTKSSDVYKKILDLKMGI